MKETELLTLPGKATATSLELPPRLDYDEWRIVLFRCVQLKHFAQFAIGDALNYGEKHWGEMYAQAASETGLSEDTLTIFKYVATRVHSLIRIKNWTACRQVAKLAPQEQNHWLQRFEKEGWSVQELIHELTAAGLRNTRQVLHEMVPLTETEIPREEVRLAPAERPRDEYEPDCEDIDPEIECHHCGQKSTSAVVICRDCEKQLK